METSLSDILLSLCFVLITVCAFRAVEWVWLKPKRLEKLLTRQGFRGHNYILLFGNTKQIGLMEKQTSLKPVEHFSHDHFPRVAPFHYKTIKDYGETSFIWDGPTPTILITKPEQIREILMKMHDFPKPILHPIMKKLTNGLIRLEGHEWSQDRKLITPAFHMHKLKNMLSAFQVSCNNMIYEWETMTSKTGSHEIEIWSGLHNMSADAISRAAFGTSFNEGERLVELLRQHIVIVVQTLQSVYVPGWRFLPTKANNKAAKITNEIEGLLKGMINKRQKALENGDAPKDDLLGILLKPQEENKEQKLSLQEVIEECKLFYIAGQETTSSLLVWTLILLSEYKDWQDRAREEVISKFGYNIPDFDGLNGLKKVNMILHEVLRLYPPINSVTRKVVQEIKLGDLRFPSGVYVNLPIGYVHQDEKLWGFDAKEFNPQRFSEGILKASQGNMSFFAFGWGPRICVGSNFAILEAKLTLTNILQRFTFEWSSSYIHAPTLSFGTLRPQFGANLIFHHL